MSKRSYLLNFNLKLLNLFHDQLQSIISERCVVSECLYSASIFPLLSVTLHIEPSMDPFKKKSSCLISVVDDFTVTSDQTCSLSLWKRSRSVPVAEWLCVSTESHMCVFCFKASRLLFDLGLYLFLLDGAGNKSRVRRRVSPLIAWKREPRTKDATYKSCCWHPMKTRCLLVTETERI